METQKKNIIPINIETKTKNNIERAVYTPIEVMDILGIGKNSVYKLIKSKPFPVLQFSKAIRIPKKAFHEWLDNLEDLRIYLD